MATRSSHGMISRDRDLDQELVNQVLAGDRDAFTSLLQRHQRRILNFMYRMVNERGFAEDLTQEVFLKVYEALPRFRGEASFATWIFRIAHNHCLNAVKRKGREVPATALAKNAANKNPLMHSPDPSPPPDELLEQQEFRALVQAKLAELTPEHRAVLVLRDIQGLSYDEIASALSLEGGTVRSRIHRARMELKEKIRSYLGA